MDINNAVEKLSNYGVGLRPALTQGNRNYAPVQAKIVQCLVLQLVMS